MYWNKKQKLEQIKQNRWTFNAKITNVNCSLCFVLLYYLYLTCLTLISLVNNMQTFQCCEQPCILPQWESSIVLKRCTVLISKYRKTSFSHNIVVYSYVSIDFIIWVCIMLFMSNCVKSSLYSWLAICRHKSLVY